VASAQNNYPNRSVKIIVPAAPGGAADVLPRIVSEKLAVAAGLERVASGCGEAFFS
jgi:tripartite-type tricarboxylate transporter receptor subunit TctC